jgi:periplasmic protein TonB
MSARQPVPGELALPGRVHPAALVLAILLHLVALGLLLRTARVVPPPVTVTLSLAAAPSAVVRSGAAPAPRLAPARPPAMLPPVPPPVLAPPVPPPRAAAAPVPRAAVAAPAPPVLSSASPEAPATPAQPVLAPRVPGPPTLSSASPEVSLTSPPPPQAITARPPPLLPSLALPLPLPPPPAPRPPPERAVQRPAPRPVRQREPAAPSATRSPSAARSEGASGAVAPSGRVAQSSSWLRAVGAWLEAHKFYPDLARARGEQGTVIVRFVVARSGRVLGVGVLHGSGSRILDRATERLLRGAALPPFPPTMKGSETTVTFAIRYLLEP